MEYFYSLSGPVNITMNDHSANGYVAQQQTVPVEMLERMFQRNEEHWQSLTRQIVDLLERAIKMK